MPKSPRSHLWLTGDPAGRGSHLWFSVELREGWTACYRLIPRAGRPVVAELRVVPSPVKKGEDGEPRGRPEPPGDGLTAAVVKDEVVLGRHVYEVLPAALKRQPGWKAAPVRVGGQQVTLFEAVLGRLGFDPGRKPKRGRRGPKGWPDEDYAQLAAEYVAACASGSASPVLDLARARGMEPAALRAALHRARRRGMLTRQTAGRAGGTLTALAKRLLKKRR